MKVKGTRIADTVGVFKSGDFAQGVSHSLPRLALLNVCTPPGQYSSLSYGSNGMRRFHRAYECNIRGSPHSLIHCFLSRDCSASLGFCSDRAQLLEHTILPRLLREWPLSSLPKCLSLPAAAQDRCSRPTRDTLALKSKAMARRDSVVTQRERSVESVTVETPDEIVVTTSVPPRTDHRRRPDQPQYRHRP